MLLRLRCFCVVEDFYGAGLFGDEEAVAACWVWVYAVWGVEEQVWERLGYAVLDCCLRGCLKAGLRGYKKDA